MIWNMLLHLVLIIYWLALSTWFGGVLFVAIAAPVIFRTVRQAKPILPHVLRANLENQHGTLLSGEIVGNLLTIISRVGWVCAIAIMGSLVGQFFLTARDEARTTMMLIRALILLAAAGISAYDRRIIWPKISANRRLYIDHADEPEIANPAKELFDRYHKQSVSNLMTELFLLLGLILFSATMAAHVPMNVQFQPQ